MRYTHAQRAEFAQAHAAGHDVLELCRQYGISKSTAYSWIKRYTPHRTSSGTMVSQQQLCLLQKAISKVETENRILKECGCSYSASLGEKLSALEKLHGKYSVHALCRALGVHRATFYNHIFRRPEKTMLQLEEDRLRPAIREIHEQTGGRQGSKKIRIKLMERGFKVSAKKVTQLMKEMRLSIQPYVKKRIPNKIGGRHNRLNQNFNPPAPNIAWCGDITRLKVLGSDFYLCVVIELYSRKVLAYRISDINSSSFVIEAC